ncbi:aldo/keto reductase [Haloechinothrix salitolerans]|uniref:Aldo/keto reductase n=1 Tax=Haloechinothrix salitolerans TaxID=926830 RepID=A0ABW2BY88_9PSEU
MRAFHLLFHAFGARIDAKATQTAVDAAIDQETTLFDTADVYGFGRSETLQGKALGPLYEGVIVATKFDMDMQGLNVPDCGARGSGRCIGTTVETSLRRHGTDWIDLYQLATNVHALE